VATDHLEKVRGEKFVAVDATQRIIGQPISQEEMEVRRREGFKQSQVVYEITEPKEEVVVIEKREEKDTYAPPPYDNYGRESEKYKYNLYSFIDQPVNECRLFGCGKCSGLPPNEIIAKENHPPSIIRP
jgi:hypothetical protein